MTTPQITNSGNRKILRLRPCPFCRSKPHYVTSGWGTDRRFNKEGKIVDYGNRSIIYCDNYGKCPVTPKVHPDRIISKEKIFLLWNGKRKIKP